jgi:two-component system chemotaxis sensor kinase CheA
LDKLADGLQYLQKHPENKATLERLRHEVHSLKGDSRSVGLENVVALTHQVEEILLSIKASETILTPDVSDRLYQGLDAIGLLVYEAVTGESSGVDTAEVLNSLMQALLESQQLQPEADAVEAEQPMQAVEVLVEQIDQYNTIISEAINRNATQIAPTFIKDEELRNIYQISSEENLQKLSDGLLQLQRHPPDETILEQLLREAHSLKGDSRSVGVENVVTLTHQIEEILLSIKASEIIFTPDVGDRLYEGLDAIGLLIYEAVTGQSSRLIQPRYLTI